MYPAQLVNPMKAELTEHGFEELLTPEQVDAALPQKGTTLFVVNSVCGCSAGTARPGVLASLNGEGKKPDHKVTSFAGFDIDAVKQARAKYLLPYPPSSPAIALFKDGQLVHMIERHMIEGRSAAMIAANLKAAYEEYCN
ncbi:MAG: BrxA/BrxB family bacilliredoxin [Edaphocola sp.]